MNGSTFYFCDSDIGKTISSRNNEFTEHARNYLLDFYKNPITLNEVLVKVGTMVEDLKYADIDLSPEALEKDTIINLLI